MEEYPLLPAETILPVEAPGNRELLRVRGRLCQCLRTEEGVRVERLLSTDPADYLDKAWAPGAEVSPLDLDKDPFFTDISPSKGG